LEVTARSAADILKIEHNSAALFYKKIRQVITHRLQHENNEMFDGCIELDESYFGGVRKGKLWQVKWSYLVSSNAKEKFIYTVVVPDTKANTLMPIISSKIKPDNVVYTDSYRSYNALDVSRFHHERINHSTDFAKGKNHIDGIENFLSQAK